MTFCPQCSGPLIRDRIGLEGHKREVDLCTTCWTTYPIKAQLVFPEPRRDVDE